jgi:thiamine-phosphate pyrophosphorylase
MLPTIWADCTIKATGPAYRGLWRRWTSPGYNDGMKLEFTPALQTAFDRARHFATVARTLNVAPRHFLAGLLVEEEGRAAALLADAGADWPRVQQHLGLPAEVDLSKAHELELHPSFQVIMAQARDLAIAHGNEGSIATEHALLALLTVNSSLRQELEGFGLDFERLRLGIVGEPAALVMDEPLFIEEPTEQIDVARILDANANRAREACRVLEDHARFTLADAFLSATLKQLRHDLTEALYLLPLSLLLEARDTPNDVGTTISTAAEWERDLLASVVQANGKRLQEALRSLEEYGKVLSVEFAQRVEKLRYQCYTLERALMRGGAAHDTLKSARLYVLVTDALCKASLVGTVKEALLGGAQVIQLREKGLDDRTFLARARDLRQLCHAAGALFIVNDRPDLARLAEADGVHLGQEDLPVHEARRILGPNGLIGVSTHTIKQVQRAILEGASYLGVGPTFPSQTKAFEGFAGLDFVRDAFAATTLPAFAIGGIDARNAEQVLAAGARGIAVSHTICAADDPRATARALRSLLA